MGESNAEVRVVMQHRMLGEDRVDSNTQTLMAGEDFAFIAKCADLSTYCVFVISHTTNVTLSPVAFNSNPATDRGYACRAKPSAFLFLGIKNETVGSVYGLHNSKFKLDQTALKTGAAMHAALASEWLETHAAAKEQSDEL